MRLGNKFCRTNFGRGGTNPRDPQNPCPMFVPLAKTFPNNFAKVSPLFLNDGFTVLLVETFTFDKLIFVIKVDFKRNFWLIFTAAQLLIGIQTIKHATS